MGIRIKVKIGLRLVDANAHAMYRLLTGRTNGKLPPEGQGDTVVTDDTGQKVIVYVKPLGERKAGQRKRHTHRVYTVCSCGEHVPVGRLHQHKCKV
jgi:hypothetical protein